MKTKLTKKEKKALEHRMAIYRTMGVVIMVSLTALHYYGYF